MRAVFLTEALLGQGLGHVMRCLAYAAGCVTAGLSIRVFVDTPGDILPPEAEKGEWKARPESFCSPEDIVVVDSYTAPLEVYQSIRSICRRLVVLDDFRRLDYPADAILNSAPGADQMYRGTRALTWCGLDFVALRPPFWNVPQKACTPEIGNVLITTGADDSRGIAPRILRVTEGRGWVRTVIVGPGRRGTLPVQDDVVLVNQPDAERMRGEMLKADLAITTAGQTVFELGRCGVPFIPVLVAENQRANATGLQSAQMTDIWIEWDSPDFEDRLTTGIGCLLGMEQRVARSALLQSKIGGGGPVRFAENLLHLVQLPVAIGED